MKRIAVLFCLAGLLFAAAPVFAQVPNPVAEQNWQTYLSNHPGLAENPQLLNNQAYLNQHPGLATWLQQHPAVAQQARRQGMWDRQGNWHDSSWWHQHNPSWSNQHHPEWARNHTGWRW